MSAATQYAETNVPYLHAVADQTPISVTAVSTKAEIDAMLDFIDSIYAQDRAYTAPLRALMRRKLSDKNPLFESADLELFVARRDGEIVGTISALRDHKHERVRGEKAAFFGFFEAVDNDVAQALITRVAERARAWGAEVLRGPRNLSRSEEVGVVVDGHDEPSPMLAAHNDSRYAGMLEELGFETEHDVLAYDIAMHDADGNAASYPDDLLERANGVTLTASSCVRRAGPGS